MQVKNKSSTQTERPYKHGKTKQYQKSNGLRVTEHLMEDVVSSGGDLQVSSLQMKNWIARIEVQSSITNLHRRRRSKLV